ncbi:uncharacterized protein LOC131954210 [Physella acuta]|uniref:uncharacterized protein LOC131954210 n=1 Tax=Physella acuta TaxID=109671 RepID=UPI0027DD678E|nr:uncharacterized protein LOC131954210 [Physella acuta]
MAGIFIPACENEVCVEGRRRLVEASRTLGHVVAPNQIGGRYAHSFKKQFDACRCIVLHKCPAFYNKIKFHSLDQYLLDNDDKLYCVHYGNTTETGGSEFEEFFNELTICPATNDSNIAEFLNNFLVNSGQTTDTHHSNVASVISLGHGVHQAITLPSTQNSSNDVRLMTDGRPEKTTQHSNQAIVPNVADLAENKSPDFTHSLRFFRPNSLKTPKVTDNFVTQISQYKDIKISLKFGDLCLVHQKEMNAGCLVHYKGNIANKNKTVARLDSRTNMFDFSRITTMSELAGAVKKIETDQESLKINAMFVVQKMLPALSQHCSTDCIALIAANTGNVLIQSRALDTLELLLFKGRITQHKVDIDMLDRTQQLLAKSFYELRVQFNKPQVNEKLECLIRRWFNIICMLQIETASYAKDTQRNDENGIFGVEMRRFAKNRKLANIIEEGLFSLDRLNHNEIENISRQCFNKSFKEQDTVLSSKKSSTQFVAVLLSLKQASLTMGFVSFQLFYSMDLEMITFLEECVKNSRKKSLAVSVVDLIFRGLAHFLCQLRETTESDISALCERVVNLIEILPQQNMPPEVEMVLVSHMFGVTPAIRKNLIDLFKRKQLYNERLPAYLVQEIEQSLAPLLVVDKKNLEAASASGEWFHLTGQYLSTVVDIHVHKLTEECHRSSDCINFRRSNNTQQHKNQMFCLGKLQHEKIIKILACQDKNIPLFYITEHHKNLQECLKNKMENGNPYPDKYLLDILIHVAEALTFCHSKDFVHANLTAASVFIGADGVKLGGFYIATFVQGDGEKLLGDASKIPTRWSAPETLKRFKVSKMSDVWMFAHLMYEVLNHGLLPYSHIQMDDQECANKICDGSIKLCKETNLKEELHKLIEDCTRTDPTRRPSMEEVLKQLQMLGNNKENETSERSSLKDAELIKRRSSFLFKTGDQSNNYCSNPTEIKRELKATLSNYLNIYTKDKILMSRETLQFNLTDEIRHILESGKLESILPRIDIFLHKNILKQDKQSIEIYLPVSCKESLLEIIMHKRNITTRERCMTLFIKVAELLQKFHHLGFILGDVRCSRIFTGDSGGDVTVCPVSLSHLNKIGSQKSCNFNNVDIDSVQSIRAPPESKGYNYCYTPAFDIYLLGRFMCDVVRFMYIDNPVDLHELQYESMADILESENSTDLLKHKLWCPTDLMRRCLDVNPDNRPTLTQILSELSTFNPNNGQSEQDTCVMIKCTNYALHQNLSNVNHTVINGSCDSMSSTNSSSLASSQSARSYMEILNPSDSSDGSLKGPSRNSSNSIEILNPSDSSDGSSTSHSAKAISSNSNSNSEILNTLDSVNCHVAQPNNSNIPVYMDILNPSDSSGESLTSDVVKPSSHQHKTRPNLAMPSKPRPKHTQSSSTTSSPQSSSTTSSPQSSRTTSSRVMPRRQPEGEDEYLAPIHVVYPPQVLRVKELIHDPVALPQLQTRKGKESKVRKIQRIFVKKPKSEPPTGTPKTDTISQQVTRPVTPNDYDQYNETYSSANDSLDQTVIAMSSGSTTWYAAADSSFYNEIDYNDLYSQSVQYNDEDQRYSQADNHDRAVDESSDECTYDDCL